jgi:hypothetical protein
MITLDLNTSYFLHGGSVGTQVEPWLNIHLQADSKPGYPSKVLLDVAGKIATAIAGKTVLFQGGQGTYSELVSLPIDPIDCKDVLDRSLEYSAPENQEQFLAPYEQKITVRVNLCFFGDLCSKLEEEGFLTTEKASKKRLMFTSAKESEIVKRAYERVKNFNYSSFMK